MAAAANSKQGLLWIMAKDAPLMADLFAQTSERYDVTLKVARCAKNFFEILNTAEEYPSGVVICAHGTPDSFQLGDHKVVTSTDVSKKCKFIKGRGTSVVLMSCNTGKGENPIAARVAELGFKVLAPTVTLRVLDVTLHPDLETEYPIHFPDSRIFSSNGSTSEYQLLPDDRYDALKSQIRDGHDDSIEMHDVENFLLEASLRGDVEGLELLKESALLSHISSIAIEKSLLYSQKNNHVATVDALIKSDRFKDIYREALAFAFLGAARNGYEGITKALMKSDRFEKIPEIFLTTALLNAARDSNEAIAVALMESSRFGEIPSAAVSEAFVCADRSSSEDIIKALIGSGRFGEVSSKDLVNIFLRSRRKESEGIVVAVIKSSRFGEIPSAAVSKAFARASRSSSEDIIKALIGSGRFGEVSSNDLVNSVLRSRRKAKEGTVVAVIKSSRFGDIPQRWLSSVLEEAAGHGHEGIIKALIESPRFGEIPLKNVERALQEAARNGYGAIATMLTHVSAVREEEAASAHAWTCFEKGTFVEEPDTFYVTIETIASLPESLRNIFFGRVYTLGGSPETDDLQWGQHHFMDDPSILRTAFYESVVAPFKDRLPRSVEGANTLFKMVSEADGQSDGDSEYGMHHVFSDIARLNELLAQL